MENGKWGTNHPMEKTYIENRCPLIVGRWPEEGFVAGIRSFYEAHFPSGEIPLCSPLYKEAQLLSTRFLCAFVLNIICS